MTDMLAIFRRPSQVVSVVIRVHAEMVARSAPSVQAAIVRKICGRILGQQKKSFEAKRFRGILLSLSVQFAEVQAFSHSVVRKREIAWLPN
ncbi:hypothetical protein [Pandoraea oxalativorans]|uniref:hypothetical protein n=1 Tax=Pandoraea oxalativorans TaxID=573737 RepID=UPI0014722386|nr:hypothetical protein [Pandoraea oxalativorans]